jgi:hypothetical protein
MTFLNQKEQVFDIQLTRHGKYLLSKGQLNPVYYAFFDDDILYDTQYAGYTEDKNKAEERIQEETPRTAVQYLFGGAETAIFTSNKGEELGLIGSTVYDKHSFKLQDKPDKLLSPQLPIGTSQSNNNFIPSWTAHFLKGELQSASTVLSSSANVPDNKKIANQQIPQLNTNIEYKKHIFNDGATQQELDAFTKDDFVSEKFSDNSVFTVAKDYLLIRLEEENGVFEKENFEIEFFEVFEEKDDDGNVISSEEQSLLFLENVFEEPGISNVDYYFDIQTDAEIDPDLLCKGIARLKTKRIFIDDKFNCDDDTIKVSKNIYIDTNEFEEKCD